MPGRRRDFDGQYAMIDMPFLLGTDRRIIGEDIGFRGFVHAIWGLAVNERRELLPKEYNKNNLKLVAQKINCSLTECEIYFPLMLQRGLLKETRAGRLRVCGVKSKHQNLKWKNGGAKTDLKDPINRFIGPYKRPQKEKEKEKEKKEEKKEEKEKKVRSARKRAPTSTEKYFIEGFKAKYGIAHLQIKKGHAIALAKICAELSGDEVKRKIDSWWEADLTVKGNRDLRAFIAWFDSIPVVESFEKRAARYRREAGS